MGWDRLSGVATAQRRKLADRKGERMHKVATDGTAAAATGQNYLVFWEPQFSSFGTTIWFPSLLIYQWPLNLIKRT